MEVTTTPSIDEKFYSWHQTPDELNVTIKLFESLPHVGEMTPTFSKSDVKVSIKSSSLEVSFKDRQILSGELFSTIKCDESTWVFSDRGQEKNGTIEMTLTKAKEGEIWSYLMTDMDRFGEYKNSTQAENPSNAANSVPKQPTKVFALFFCCYA